MDSLSKYILTIIQSDRYGGRTIRTDETTVILYDCGVWTDAHSHAVYQRYPECSISIVQSQASLSGFMVVFKMEIDRAVKTWMIITVFMIVVMFFTARQMMFLSKEHLG